MRTVHALVVSAALLAGCQAVKNVASGKATTDDIKTIGEGATKAVKTVQSLSAEMTVEQEYYVGRSIATNILAKNEYKYANKPEIAAGKLVGVTAYVNHVGGLVSAAAMEAHREGDRPMPVGGWHFVVMESDAVNGMAAPGGYVFVTTAAVKLAKSEDELAGILAHEVAHVMRGHALGNIKKSRYANVSSDLLQAAGKEALTPEQAKVLTDAMGGIIDDTMEALFVKGYSRDTEFEADKLAVQIAAAAGYDPGGVMRFLDSLSKVQDTGKGGFFATHPSAADRIAQLKDTVASLPAVKVPKTRVDRFATATAKLK